MFSFWLSKDNYTIVTETILRSLKVNARHIAVEEAVQEHPDYPSLLSISDSLSRWHIDTLAKKIY